MGSVLVKCRDSGWCHWPSLSRQNDLTSNWVLMWCLCTNINMVTSVYLTGRHLVIAHLDLNGLHKGLIKDDLRKQLVLWKLKWKIVQAKQSGLKVSFIALIYPVCVNSKKWLYESYALPAVRYIIHAGGRLYKYHNSWFTDC